MRHLPKDDTHPDKPACRVLVCLESKSKFLPIRVLTAHRHDRFAGTNSTTSKHSYSGSFVEIHVSTSLIPATRIGPRRDFTRTQQTMTCPRLSVCHGMWFRLAPLSPLYVPRCQPIVHSTMLKSKVFGFESFEECLFPLCLSYPARRYKSAS